MEGRMENGALVIIRCKPIILRTFGQGALIACVGQRMQGAPLQMCELLLDGFHRVFQFPLRVNYS